MAADLFTSVSLWEEPDPDHHRNILQHRATCQMQLYRGDSFALTITHKMVGADRVTRLIEGLMFVGTSVRRLDGTWDFSTVSKATLDVYDTPVTAVIYNCNFIATVEAVEPTFEVERKVTAIKISGSIPSATVEDVVGYDLLICKLVARGAKPFYLSTLADQDEIQAHLHEWVQKLWGDQPPMGQNCLYICAATGEVFKTAPARDSYVILSGQSDITKVDFWVYEKHYGVPVFKKVALGCGWAVSMNVTNPEWSAMYDAIRQLNSEALDGIWATRKEGLRATDLLGNSVLHHVISAAMESPQLRSRAAEVLRLALVHGADSCAVGLNHRTPLHQAAEAGLDELVELLIINDGPKKARMRDNKGKRPIELAQDQGHYGAMELLHACSIDWKPRFHF